MQRMITWTAAEDWRLWKAVENKAKGKALASVIRPFAKEIGLSYSEVFNRFYSLNFKDVQTNFLKGGWEMNKQTWIEAICDADFRRVLSNQNFTYVQPMLLLTIEDAMKYHLNEEANHE